MGHASAQVTAPTFTRLDSLRGPGYVVGVSAITPDGSQVVGVSIAPTGQFGLRPVRWSGAVATNLGVPPGSNDAAAVAVDASGTVVVGDVLSVNDLAHRWDSSGINVLANVPGGVFSHARGITPAGNRIVGEANGMAAMWDSSGVQVLPSLGAPAVTLGTAAAIDAAGNVVVGTSFTVTYGEHAAMWTGNAVYDLGTLPGDSESHAQAVSGDGNVIIGSSGPGGSTRVFRYVRNRPSNNMQAIPLGGAYCTNFDGSVVGGYIAGNQVTAGLWTPQGVIDLESYLRAVGINLNGLRLTSVLAISADGTSLCGQAWESVQGVFAGFHIRHLPVGFFPSTEGCGGLFALPAGRAIRGGSVSFALTNGQGFQGFLAGMPVNSPLSGCPGCTIGVSGVTVGPAPTISVPNTNTLLGMRLGFQGFDLGTGSCLSVLRLAATFDVTIE